MSEEKIFEKLNDASGVYFTGTLVESRRTSFQLLEVYETPELGRIFRLDGCNMTSERDEFFYHENLVHPALIAHTNPRAALVIGGGDGGSSEEILKHATIEHVRMVELDPVVIEVAREKFRSVHRDAFDDPRLQVTVGDGLAYLKQPARKYDFIALDLTDPAGPAAQLYTPGFFRDCQGALLPGGALALHIGSPFAHPQRVKSCLDDLRAVFPFVQPGFVHIPLYGSVWGFAYASDTLDARAIAPAEVEARLAKRGVGDRQYYNGEIHAAMFALPEYVKRIVN
jgi:spermidine synthase